MKLLKSLWRKPVFAPYFRVLTYEARLALSPDDIEDAFQRHIRGDWGEVAEETRRSNEAALEHGGRVRSVFVSDAGIKFEVNSEYRLIETVVDLAEGSLEEIDEFAEGICH